jgi:hypothetical protein
VSTTGPGRPADDTEGRPLRRWNRLTFRFFGPPQIGRYDGPYPEVDRDPPCPFCGSSESAHETFHTAEGKTLRRCPVVATGASN